MVAKKTNDLSYRLVTFLVAWPLRRMGERRRGVRPSTMIRPSARVRRRRATTRHGERHAPWSLPGS
jgi:hypothetical protein